MQKVQMRMAEAQKKMMQDDIIDDDMLMVATSRSDLFKQAESKLDMQCNNILVSLVQQSFCTSISS